MSDIIRKPAGAPGSTGGQFDGRTRTAAGGSLSLEGAEIISESNPDQDVLDNAFSVMKTSRLGGDGREVSWKTIQAMKEALGADPYELIHADMTIKENRVLAIELSDKYLVLAEKLKGTLKGRYDRGSAYWKYSYCSDIASALNNSAASPAS